MLIIKQKTKNQQRIWGAPSTARRLKGQSAKADDPARRRTGSEPPRPRGRQPLRAPWTGQHRRPTHPSCPPREPPPGRPRHSCPRQGSCERPCAPRRQVRAERPGPRPRSRRRSATPPQGPSSRAGHLRRRHPPPGRSLPPGGLTLRVGAAEGRPSGVMKDPVRTHRSLGLAKRSVRAARSPPRARTHSHTRTLTHAHRHAHTHTHTSARTWDSPGTGSTPVPAAAPPGSGAPWPWHPLASWLWDLLE